MEQAVIHFQLKSIETRATDGWHLDLDLNRSLTDPCII